MRGISHFFSPVSGLMAVRCPKHGARADLGQARGHAGRARTERRRRRRTELLDARQVPRARVDETGVRVERDRHGVRAARRPDLDFFSGEEPFVDVGQHRTAGRQIDARCPIHLDERMRGDQPAVGAIDDVQEAVLVGLDHHLAALAVDVQIGEHVLVVAVDVVDVIRRVLVVADDLAGLRSNRDHAGRVRDCPSPRAASDRTAPRCRLPSRPDRARDRTSPSATSARRRTSTRRCPSARSRIRVHRARESCIAATASCRSRDPIRRGTREWWILPRHPRDQHAVGDDGCAGRVVALACASANF